MNPLSKRSQRLSKVRWTMPMEEERGKGTRMDMTKGTKRDTKKVMRKGTISG